MTNFVTDSTCNEACWMAKEPICRCSCGGANHGILLDATSSGAPPVRTKRVKDQWFRLYAVASYFDSHRITRAFLIHRREDPMFPNTPWYKHPAGEVHASKATVAQQLNWSEVGPFFVHLNQLIESGTGLAMGDMEPYLVWIPQILTPEWLDAHPIEYEPSRKIVE